MVVYDGGMTEPSARPDPYELVFGGDNIDDRLFPPIGQEAEARDLPTHDPERFVFLSSVGKLLQAIAGSAQEPAQEVPQGALAQYGRLLFHAFHYWRGGRRAWAVDEDRLRWLLDEVTTVGPWTLTPPAASGYLRLPRNLVWAAPAPDAKPEPADGLFWFLASSGKPGEGDEGAAQLHVLLALGVRADRPGFSIVTATGVLDDEPHWAEVDGRPGATDFESTLPGGELDRLYSVETAAELLKLASLCFWHLDPASG